MMHRSLYKTGAAVLGLCALAALTACASRVSDRHLSKPVASALPLANARFSLFVLGTAQDGGVPHVGCKKPCCEEARRSGKHAYPVSLGVVDRSSKSLVLFEASPELDAQIALLHEATGLTGRGRNPVDAVVLTHAHIGHYAGLVHFGREVASTKELPVWASARMSKFLSEHAPWKQLVDLEQIRLQRIDTEFAPVEGLRVEAIPVPHRDEFSDTMAFKIHGPNRCVLFVPDVDAWDHHPGLLGKLLRDVDVAYIDGTFWDGRELPGRDISEIPHPLIVDTMKRLASHAQQKPGSIRFLHMNHTNPLWRDAGMRRAVVKAGFGIAQRGERIDL